MCVSGLECMSQGLGRSAGARTAVGIAWTVCEGSVPPQRCFWLLSLCVPQKQVRRSLCPALPADAPPESCLAVSEPPFRMASPQGSHPRKLTPASLGRRASTVSGLGWHRARVACVSSCPQLMPLQAALCGGESERPGHTCRRPPVPCLTYVLRFCKITLREFW